GGYLARVTRYSSIKDKKVTANTANLVTQFGYDPYGNVSLIWDGKGNPTRFQYNPQNLLVKVISREPFKHETAFRHDGNGNLIAKTVVFDRYEYDPIERAVIPKKSRVFCKWEYNALNNVVRRIAAFDGREIEESFIRDASENIIRRVQPSGNATEYRFDE